MAEKEKEGARSWRKLFGKEKAGEEPVAGPDQSGPPAKDNAAAGTSPEEVLETLITRLGISLEQPRPGAPATPGFSVPFPVVEQATPAGEGGAAKARVVPQGKPESPPEEPIEQLLQRLVNKPAEPAAEKEASGPAKSPGEGPGAEQPAALPRKPAPAPVEEPVKSPPPAPVEVPREEPPAIPVTKTEGSPEGEPIEQLLQRLVNKPGELKEEKPVEAKNIPEPEEATVPAAEEELPARPPGSPAPMTVPVAEPAPPVFEEAAESGEAGEIAPPQAAGPEFTPAKKTIWSEGNAGEAEGGVISIDQIDDLSGLILPRGASFEIDELKIRNQSGIFSPKGTEGIPFQSEELRKSDISQSGMRTIAQEAAGVEAEGEKKSAFSKLNILSVIRHEVVEYNPRIHGPMVNLKWRPKPGMEEIEMYPVNEPYAYVRIIYDHATHEYTYEVLEPELSPAEIDLFREIKERIFERLDINTTDVIADFAKKTLRSATDDIIADFGIKLTPLEREKILYQMYKEFLGNGKIDPIMHDRYIEDISCDGVNTHLFVYHSRYESMRTNLEYKSAEELDSFVTKLAQKSGKYISIAEPMLDATMSDGSRIQMTLGHEVTAHGSTFTIRKFRDEPISPTDLIEWSTFSPLSIAFLWLAVESGKSAIFAGGTASGKTTSLNAISLFIPPLAKIVTLEDTRELKLPHPNWIPSVTRASFDTAGKGEIDMYELLRAALRQRPEYIIVGEVRGREALTLFQAMSTGHVTYSTMHADSVASIVHRLENPPLNVPRNMLSALDIVCVQVQARVGGQRIRRNKQLIEILDLDPRTNELITNEVFKWHPSTDEITYSGKSFILEEIMEERGWDESRMREELKMRQEVLEWMRIKKIRNYQDVSNILIQYHREPASVMERVRADLYE
ncbi:flagellar protein FlaI [Methanolinea mesophila]|uniref:ATPase, T2SS/T4P/T4SS family n=1 Tax=Methanolinea mesophila TaxID=547055 RepID=UPI001AEB8F26|nr:ATPase, T2SS/T4P/T4SS family [Methanolinea mesophila]MBP1929402.1 flagellar protein FlaI [Methanolinea mesophila]